MTAQGNNALRPVSLTTASAGMSRMRVRGGASPATLYDLENGYILPSKAPAQRPGTTFKFTLPPNTKGLCAFDGTLHTFTSGTDPLSFGYILPAPSVSVTPSAGGSLIAGSYSYRVTAISFWGEGPASDPIVVNVAAGSKNLVSWVAVPGALQYAIYGRTPNNELQMQFVAGSLTFIDIGVGTPSGPPVPKVAYAVDVLRHPDPEFVGQITAIHFSAPFMGYLYVVAEFDDGQIFHYYLRNPSKWSPNHEYLDGDVVQPTTPNGYYYKATPKVSPVAWAPGVKRAVNDVVQPTTANGFKYTVTSTSGSNPSSGSVEPDWPKLNGATVNEFAESDGTPSPPAAPPTTAPPPPDGYNNPGGTAPPRSPIGGTGTRTPTLNP